MMPAAETPILRIVHSFDAPDERVAVEFADLGAQTRVTFLHEGVPEQVARGTHEKGWADTFDALDRYLRGAV